MGTIYRCVCPDCTGYICSKPEPFSWEDEPGVNGEYWGDCWVRECEKFLNSPCPHYGDGVENQRKFEIYE